MCQTLVLEELDKVYGEEAFTDAAFAIDDEARGVYSWGLRVELSDLGDTWAA
jgi:hypothetical protein